MRLDISDVLVEVGKSLSYDVHEPPLVDEDIECVQPVTGKLDFINTGSALLIRGRIATAVALPCSRCNEYFEEGINAQVEEQFELRHVSAGPRTLQNITIIEEDESPIAGKLMDGQIFDLTEMVRQYVFIEKPNYPLPKELPDGRCSQCLRSAQEVLAKLDTDPDVEEESDINPAFAKLQSLLPEKSPDETDA